MKTVHEQKFERLIHSIIDLMAKTEEEKSFLTEQFDQNSGICYDCFCDVIYYISRSSGGSNTLSIDEQGKSHLNIRNKNNEHLYFDVMTLEDPVPLYEDIVLYIDIALNELEKRISEYQKESQC